MAKRRKVLATVTQGLATSEDDDNVSDAIDICDILESTQEKHTSSAGAIYALGETIRNTLLEINAIREENRERRHKELLEVITKMVQHDTNAQCDIGQTQPPLLSQKTKHIKSPSKSNQVEEKVNEVIAEQQYIMEEIKENAAEQQYIVEEITMVPQNNQQSTDTSSPSLRVINNSELVEGTKKLNNQKVCDSTKILNSIEKDSSLKKFSSTSKPSSASGSTIPNMTWPLANRATSNKKVSSKTSSALRSTLPINMPLIIGNRVTSNQKDSKQDLQTMRANMIEMQRKKMEDRERKKRELQEIKIYD